jgi:hypothetical protein
MDLASYRKAFGVSYAHIAKLAGCSAYTVIAIAGRRRRPGWHLAGKIESATNGHVPRSLWFEGATPLRAEANSVELEPGTVSHTAAVRGS